MGPEADTFLEAYLDKAYRQAKVFMSRARAVGVSLDELARWAREDWKTIDFKLNLLEEKHGQAVKIGV